MEDIDVDALLGEGDEISPEPDVSADAESLVYTEIANDDSSKKLEEGLAFWNKSCRDLFIDFRHVNLEVTDEEMCLKFDDSDFFPKPLYFKINPDDPKNPLIIHAWKQFCKIVGIPVGFFMDARPSLKKQIYDTWKATLSADEKKATCIARIRDSQDCAIIRALVPDNFSALQNHEIINIINQSIDYKFFRLEDVKGDQRDDLILHARYVFGEVFKVSGQEACLGFSVTASELGACPLNIDSFLYLMESKTVFFATYGKESFFQTKYEGVQPNELKELFPKLIQRIESEKDEIKERVEEADKEVIPMDEAVKIRDYSKIPTKFKKSLFKEVAANSDDMGTKLDFARHVGLIAKDFDVLKRTQIERAAGKYLNLVFSKK